MNRTLVAALLAATVAAVATGCGEMHPRAVKAPPAGGQVAGGTPANQQALDIAAGDAATIAGSAYYTGAIVDDDANAVTIYLAGAPQSILARLRSADPGIYVIHNDAPRPRSVVTRIQNHFDMRALRSAGIDVVSLGPTEDGYLRVGVTSHVAAAQAKLDAIYGPNVIRVVHAEPGALL